MKRFIVHFGLPATIVLLLSSCFLFRKNEGTVIPPPETSKPVEEKPAPPPPKSARSAPFNVPAFGRKELRPVYQVALFTPLSVDQVLSDTGFSVNSSAPLPPGTVAGLEFYEGALLAMDSLRQEGIPLHLTVYDTKSLSRPLNRLLNSGQLDSTHLILGSVNSSELKQISNFAKQKKINFISVTYPNDAGISDNPFLTILNTTLRVHCNAIQDFAQRKFSDKNIVVVYQNNSQEKQNLAYLQQAYAAMNYSGKAPLHPFEWTNNTTASDLSAHLDQNKNNVIILTALYPQVSLSIIGQLIALTDTYRVSVVGMPTLDGLADLRKSQYKGMDVFYSTPYPYLNATDHPAIKSMMWHFFNKYHSRPSDMALKGYESLFYFGKLLHKDGIYFNADLNDPVGRLLTQFQIQPIYRGSKDASTPPDYFENTRLYFMRVRDGKVTRAN
jgi:ABC-type branched-subunit amino acid transport system substrate-binding protein